MKMHPVSFTTEQIKFIIENLIELANQYAHVQEVVDGVYDIEETIVKAEYSEKQNEEEINPDYDCPYCGLQGGH